MSDTKQMILNIEINGQPTTVEIRSMQDAPSKGSLCAIVWPSGHVTTQWFSAHANMTTGDQNRGAVGYFTLKVTDDLYSIIAAKRERQRRNYEDS